MLGLLSLPAIGQTPLTGRVLSDEQEALVGVTVLIKNTSRGTITDAAGRFEIAAAPTDTLRLSYLGFTTQEVVVGTSTVLELVMTASTSVLDEVVVLGYGSVRRSDLTGSVASISAEKISSMPITRAAQIGRASCRERV